MTISADSFGRISKLLVDRHDVTLDEAQAHLRNFQLDIFCGQEVATSPSLQAALLTATNIASRCFPGGVRVIGIHPSLRCVVWRQRRTLGEVLAAYIPASALADYAPPRGGARSLIMGSCDFAGEGLRVTFDGWTCAVSPPGDSFRLPERDGCILSGIAAGALGISELFLGNFGFDIDAGTRRIGLSLWRPEIPWDHPEAAAADYPIRFLPRDAWLIGLGHLGQAFGWSLSLLPFSAPDESNILLQDFDRTCAANMDTGLLTDSTDIGKLKTRVVTAFLESRGFRPLCTERRFDEHTHPQVGEPRIMLAGMDGQGPRHLLDRAGSDCVIDCGVGGSASNFDSITLHMLPQANRSAAQIWPPSDAAAIERREQHSKRLAESRKLYRAFKRKHACGHVDLAGKAVAVPFVGAFASALALAEVIRRIHRVHGYASMHARLSWLTNVTARAVAETPGAKVPRIPFQAAGIA